MSITQTIAVIKSRLREIAVDARSEGRCPMPVDTSETKALAARYAKLQERSAIQSPWPDRSAQARLMRGLTRAPSGRLAPTVFPEDAPLEVVFFPPPGTALQSLLLEAQQRVFKPFIAEVRAGLSAKSQAALDAAAYWTPPESAHIVLLVFSEHPSLLAGEQRAKWHRVPQSAVDGLVRALHSDRTVSNVCPMRLQLDGFTVTPDGSMLALFQQRPSAAGSAGSSLLGLRRELHRVGTAALGELNSRPKDLVHMSVGRLFEFPAELTAREQAHVDRTVRAWGAALAAGTLAPADAAGGAGAVPVPVPGLYVEVVVDRAEVVRDTQWMMLQRQTHGLLAFAMPSDGQ